MTPTSSEHHLGFKEILPKHGRLAATVHAIFENTLRQETLHPKITSRVKDRDDTAEDWYFRRTTTSERSLFVKSWHGEQFA